MKYRKNESVVLTALDDGAILLDLNSKYYYSLNETGVKIWQMLNGSNGASEIAKELVKDFVVDEGKALASTNRLLKELEENGLIVKDRE